jgi:hypothetical protein
MPEKNRRRKKNIKSSEGKTLLKSVAISDGT